MPTSYSNYLPNFSLYFRYLFKVRSLSYTSLRNVPTGFVARILSNKRLVLLGIGIILMGHFHYVWDQLISQINSRSIDIATKLLKYYMDDKIKPCYGHSHRPKTLVIRLTLASRRQTLVPIVFIIDTVSYTFI